MQSDYAFNKHKHEHEGSRRGLGGGGLGEGTFSHQNPTTIECDVLIYRCLGTGQSIRRKCPGSRMTATMWTRNRP